MALRNNEIGHAWYHDQHSGSGGSSNFYWREDTIYSYGSHFAIATKYDAGRTVVLTTRSYSVSTSAHVSITRQAIPNNVNVIEMNGCLNQYADKRQHKALYNETLGQIPEIEKSLARMRAGGNPQIAAIAEINSIIENCNAYTKYFKLGYRQKPLFAIDQEKLNKVRAKQLAQKRKDDAERLERNKQLIDRWLAGDNVQLPHGVKTVYCRVNGDNVQTSKGASFPKKHAALAWRMVKKCLGRNEGWRSNGHTIKLGHYSVTSIDSDGTLTAGCHVVKLAQMLPIARELGIESRAITATTKPAVPAFAE